MNNSAGEPQGNHADQAPSITSQRRSVTATAAATLSSEKPESGDSQGQHHTPQAIGRPWGSGSSCGSRSAAALCRGDLSCGEAGGLEPAGWSQPARAGSRRRQLQGPEVETTAAALHVRPCETPGPRAQGQVERLDVARGSAVAGRLPPAAMALSQNRTRSRGTQQGEQQQQLRSTDPHVAKGRQRFDRLRFTEMNRSSGARRPATS